MNNLQAINNEIVMTSLEVVELINKFRYEEGNDKIKKHDDMLKSIRKEMEILKNAGMKADGNFSEGLYLDKNNQERPCYKMNKAGIMQILNKESAVVRYKTQQYIEALENRSKQQQLPSYQIQDPIERAKAWIREQEEKRLLEQTIEEQKPKVDIANKRLLKNGCYTITEVTKSLGLKRGQITKWAKANKYLHKTQIEINKKSEKYFKIYDNGGFKCIGINEEGLKLINENLEEIKNI